MVESKSRRLKVYESRIGFYDTVVSAPSRAAALRAWGTHQNLFADGEAREAQDRQAIEAALAHPGLPLRRGAGTQDGFSLKPNPPPLPDVPAAARKAKAPRRTAGHPTPRPDPEPPDRSALSAAESALRSLDDQHRRDDQAFRDRRAALDAEESAAAGRFAAARTRAHGALDRARQAYSRAGGRVDKPD